MYADSNIFQILNKEEDERETEDEEEEKRETGVKNVECECEAGVEEVDAIPAWSVSVSGSGRVGRFIASSTSRASHKSLLNLSSSPQVSLELFLPT